MSLITLNFEKGEFKMCEECHSDPCDTRCPNWEAPKAYKYCAICEEGIYPGEKYIENGNGDYAHLDCLSEDIGGMVDFIGIKIEEEMDYEPDYEEY